MSNMNTTDLIGGVPPWISSSCPALYVQQDQPHKAGECDFPTINCQFQYLVQFWRVLGNHLLYAELHVDAFILEPKTTVDRYVQ